MWKFSWWCPELWHTDIWLQVSKTSDKARKSCLYHQLVNSNATNGYIAVQYISTQHMHNSLALHQCTILISARLFRHRHSKQLHNILKKTKSKNKWEKTHLNLECASMMYLFKGVRCGLSAPNYNQHRTGVTSCSQLYLIVYYFCVTNQLIALGEIADCRFLAQPAQLLI